MNILETSTNFTKLNEDTYSVFLQPEMCIGEVPHGGYMAMIFLRIAEEYLSSRRKYPDTFKADWQFIDRTRAGMAMLLVNEIKLGNATSLIHISLHQQGILSQHPWVPGRHKSKVLVAAYITSGNFDLQRGMTISTDWNLAQEPAPVDLKKLRADTDRHWRRQLTPLMEAMPVLLILELYIQRDGHSSPATQDFWIRCANSHRFSNLTLGFVVDAFAPLVLEPFRSDCLGPLVSSDQFPLDEIFWCPTLTMSLDVKKRLPISGEEWLRVRVVCKQIRQGKYDVELVVFDVQAEIVAISQHVCFIVDMAKNYRPRAEKI